ncbi:tRNA isopentenyl-2-thiomethyl-A-37 hydroxylase MiaE [Pseudoalteromonas sp. MMG012]|uniref:tRNA isopentenyl-2-thiomethyl-A-37 hydroxylase MiaE n=1 Tax=Pseudoalteromonas sp. MMG012 TaxID=2822686 RepID=UPI003916FC77
MDELLHPIKQFLQCETPQAWIEAAIDPDNLSIVLIDHLICELKVYMCTLLNRCTTIEPCSYGNGAQFQSNKFASLEV